MKLCLVLAITLSLAVTASASAQNAPPVAPTGQTSDGYSAGPGQNQGARDQGQRGGGFGMGMGRGVLGTVTEVAADHYTISTDAGETYTVHFSVNTRILRQSAQRRGQGAEGGNPPQPIKPAEIKVGDAIAASGEVDATAKSVGAVFIMQIDPDRAKQMRAMQANYGKTWLAGKVTAIEGVNVTLLGINDHTAHTFAADENTTFRKRRDPITLTDIQVGDTIRVEGAVKDGTFVATSVVAMGRAPEGTATLPRNVPPQ
jgi:preprotein translocase subunit YajC